MILLPKITPRDYGIEPYQNIVIVRGRKRMEDVLAGNRARNYVTFLGSHDESGSIRDGLACRYTHGERKEDDNHNQDGSCRRFQFGFYSIDPLKST
jgi:hypothetical protein